MFEQDKANTFDKIVTKDAFSDVYVSELDEMDKTSSRTLFRAISGAFSLIFHLNKTRTCWTNYWPEPIYATGTPFSVEENMHWHSFFKKWRPSLKMHFHYLLSNKILDSKYQKVEKNIQMKIFEAISLGLHCDGWSNRRNEAILNDIITTPIFL